MTRIARSVLIASLALWVGGLATISFVVAPTAFKVAPSRQVAGQVVGTCLRTFGKIEIVCGLLAGASSIVLLRATKRGKLHVGLISVMLLLTLTYVGWIYPLAGEVRGATDPVGAEAFALYHRISVFLVGCNILLGTITLVCAAGARSDGA